jgi:hypothetical protein
VSESESTPPGSHYQPATWVVLVIVALFVLSAFAVLRARPTGGAANTGTTTTTTTTLHSSASTTLPVRSRVRVQVANGTLTANLARDYTQRLQAAGWDTLPPANAATKAAASVIYYTPGNKASALAIAAEVKLSASAVQPLNGLSPVAGAANDDVIVVLGPDLATAG